MYELLVKQSEIIESLVWLDKKLLDMLSFIKPFVNIQYCKCRISSFDKRQKGEQNDFKMEKVRKYGTSI